MKKGVIALVILLAAAGCAPVKEQTAAPPQAHVFPAEPESAPAAFRHGYSLLDESEQKLYDALLQSASGPELPAEAFVPAELDDNAAARVSAYFYYDQPRFFWGTPKLVRENGRRILQITGDTEVLPERRQALEAAADAFLDGVEGDDFSVVTEIHDRLVERVTRDENGIYSDSGNVYGALVDGYAICDGYARAFQYLLERRGIPCIYYSGASVKGTPHAWNAVQLDGEWYYADVTWDTLTYGRTLHLHLGITLEELQRERVFDKQQYPPVTAASDTYNYYRRNGYFIEAADGADLRDLAEAFVTALADRELSDGWRTEYLEIKVFGTPEQYEETRRVFIRDVFPLLEEMERVIAERELPISLSTQGQIKCNHKDVMQVLILLPDAKQTY